jgi:hypothetical protein
VGAAAEGDGNWPRPVPTNLGWSTGINAAMHSVAVAGVHGFPDVPHSAGLIAPRPLLIEAGMHDTGFFIDEQLAAFDHLKRIYDATGAGGDLLSLRKSPSAPRSGPQQGYSWRSAKGRLLS